MDTIIFIIFASILISVLTATVLSLLGSMSPSLPNASNLLDGNTSEYSTYRVPRKLKIAGLVIMGVNVLAMIIMFIATIASMNTSLDGTMSPMDSIFVLILTSGVIGEGVTLWTLVDPSKWGSRVALIFNLLAIAFIAMLYINSLEWSITP